MLKEKAIEILRGIARAYSGDRWTVELDPCGDDNPKPDTYRQGFMDAYALIANRLMDEVLEELTAPHAHLPADRYAKVLDAIPDEEILVTPDQWLIFQEENQDASN